jgi:hypothetical protein
VPARGSGKSKRKTEAGPRIHITSCNPTERREAGVSQQRSGRCRRAAPSGGVTMAEPSSSLVASLSLPPRLRHPYVSNGQLQHGCRAPRQSRGSRDADDGWIKIAADSAACARCQGRQTAIIKVNALLLPTASNLLARCYCYGSHQPYLDGTIPVSISIYG